MMAKKILEQKPLSKIETYYIDSLVSFKGIAEMAEDIGRPESEIESYYKQAKAKSPGKFGRPSEGVTIMTEAASIEGDEQGKANRSGNKFMAHYSNNIFRGQK
jgi:hypothetical protein